MGKGNRRSLIKRGLFGGALLSLGGGIGIGLRSSELGPEPRTSLKLFSRTQYATFAALAETVLPFAGQQDSGWPSTRAIDCAGQADALLATTHPEIGADFKQLLSLFENGVPGLFIHLRPTPFTRLSLAERTQRLQAWRTSRLVLLRTGYLALVRLTHATYYGSPLVHGKIGYPGPPEIPDGPAASGDTGAAR